MASNITTLAFSNVPASGTPIQLAIVFKNADDGTNYQVTWPSSIYWNSTTIAGSTQGPLLTLGRNSLTIVSLLTTDGGTKWRGWVEANIVGGAANSLWTWGGNGVGQLGQNDRGQNRSSPIQVGATANWIQAGVMGNNDMFALTTAGTMFSWGLNGNGYLGNNDRVDRSSPVQVGSRTDWANFAPGYSHILAITTTGQLWAWGRNNFGQIGIGTSGEYLNISSPVQVGGATNWAKVSAGRATSAAITTTGQLWTWGRGDYAGVLGHNNTVSYSIPKQVGALTTWASVSMGDYCTFATTTSGTLFSWGRNSNGELGQNDRVVRSSPTQVGALTTWASVAACGRAPAGLTTSGTLFTWGLNDAGQLGQNDRVNRSSPVQVGALTTWAKLPALGTAATAAKGVITTSGTLFTWGYNFQGQLGLNDNANRSSPIQVGAATNWISISITNSTAALRFGSLINPA
jgi:alpha-tubulin suppressor-like RCC1 family protein